ncbi:MAG: class I SAM-dependent methyltransferase [Geminicoccaceae bacterium]
MTNAAVKEEIRHWWAKAPMTYGESHGQAGYRRPDGKIERVEVGSKRFFELADERFYSWNTALHVDGVPFSGIFDYQRHASKDVLEVGCGMGCMAMNWALRGAKIAAVDLNPVAIAETRRRFDLFGLDGAIEEADGENLAFEDAHFDYAYSWGVLHHSPAPERSIGELLRVLKPGGSAGVMLYHRDSILYRYTVRFIEGFINMERLFLDELQLASRYGDGGREEGNPHTWPVTELEVYRDLFSAYENVHIRVLGTDLPPILNTWRPELCKKLSERSLDRLARRHGWSLWITGNKPS